MQCNSLFFTVWNFLGPPCGENQTKEKHKLLAMFLPVFVNKVLVCSFTLLQLAAWKRKKTCHITGEQFDSNVPDDHQEHYTLLMSSQFEVVQWACSWKCKRHPAATGRSPSIVQTPSLLQNALLQNCDSGC
jgi:hypothetical protein